jgi:hypothetical protein
MELLHGWLLLADTNAGSAQSYTWHRFYFEANVVEGCFSFGSQCCGRVLLFWRSMLWKGASLLWILSFFCGQCSGRVLLFCGQCSGRVLLKRDNRWGVLWATLDRSPWIVAGVGKPEHHQLCWFLRSVLVHCTDALRQARASESPYHSNHSRQWNLLDPVGWFDPPSHPPQTNKNKTKSSEWLQQFVETPPFLPRVVTTVNPFCLGAAHVNLVHRTRFLS